MSVEASVEAKTKRILIMKTKLLVTLVVSLLSTSLFGQDASQKLVGTWLLSATNASGSRAAQTMTTETKYNADGTFTLKGEVSTTHPSNPKARTYVKRDGVLVPLEGTVSRTISGSGIWRVEHGYLCTTLTNSSSIRTNVEDRYQIISITGERFAYRSTYHNKVPPEDAPVLTAIRKP